MIQYIIFSLNIKTRGNRYYEMGNKQLPPQTIITRHIASWLQILKKLVKFPLMKGKILKQFLFHKKTA